MGVKNFKRLLISIPKCIELNSELILILGLSPHPGPKPKIRPKPKRLKHFKFKVN